MSHTKELQPKDLSYGQINYVAVRPLFIDNGNGSELLGYAFKLHKMLDFEYNVTKMSAPIIFKRLTRLYFSSNSKRLLTVNQLVNEYLKDPNCSPVLWIQGEHLGQDIEQEFLKRLDSIKSTKTLRDSIN